MSGRSDVAVRRRARALGIAVAYTDANGRRHRVPQDTLLAVLSLLGDTPSPHDTATERRAGGDGQPPEVLVAWDGARSSLAPLAERCRGRARRDATVVGEDGSDLGPLAPSVRPGTGRGGGPLPFGVHSVHLGGTLVAHVVAAPRRPDARGTPFAASLGGPLATPGGWGLFAPGYAIRDARGRDAGDLTSLESLGTLVGRLGGRAIATLPMLAEPATADGGAPGQRPYSPTSRMFWNEAYLDLDRLPELRGAVPARALRGAVPARALRGATHAAGRHADLAAVASAARPALDVAARALLASRGARLSAFRAFQLARPDLARYARFRAACERAGTDLGTWPARWRAGRISARDVAEDAERRHAYAQFATHTQLGDVAATLRRSGVGLVVDFPVGCAPDGFDPWAFPSAFVRGASTGAPPDGFFSGGQNWGFPPPHPESDRRDGYRVLRSLLSHHLEHAAALRVDHVLGWSRLWWVPSGAPATHGTYVSYPVEELLAIACLEAWRHGASLVGEDLGTVERGLRTKLRSHGVAGTRVAVFDLGASPGPLRPPRGTVAYVDTHDTATFAGFLSAADVDERERRHLVDHDDAAAERAARAALRLALKDRLVTSGLVDPSAADDPFELLRAVLVELGESPADLVIVAAEDLLGETRAQNLPGTTGVHANFSRRLARTIEELAVDPTATALLAALGAARERTRRRRR